MKADIAAFNLTKPYILLVPGSAPNRPEKRWPAAHYGALAQALVKQGIQPVILGTKAEEKQSAIITALCPEALNLVEQTSLAQIVQLTKKSKAAIGNDTGPMHLIGATGNPCLVLFSKHSTPVRHAPKGENVQILQENALENLSVQTVLNALNNF